MRIFVICSKSMYGYIENLKIKLEEMGNSIVLPNCYDKPQTEDEYRGTEGYTNWKSEMIKHSELVISDVDAVLVLNYNKNGVDNYIGGATFLEMYDAFRLGKVIYLMNDIPEGILKDEITGFNPVILNGDLNKINIV